MAPNNNVDRTWGISQCEVGIKSGVCIGPYRSLWNGTLARPEEPKMFARGRYDYLLIAEGGTDLLHRFSIARSTSPEGPWTPAPNNPILHNGAYSNLTVQSTGHGTIIDTPDKRSYIVYLARRNVNGSSPLGRETFISRVKWVDGWPVVNDGRPVLLSQPISGLPDVAAVSRRADFFTGRRLANDWYTLRIPYFKIYSLEQSQNEHCRRGDGLTLQPNAFGLNDRDVPAAILRKQTSLDMTFQLRSIACLNSHLVKL